MYTANMRLIYAQECQTPARRKANIMQPVYSVSGSKNKNVWHDNDTTVWIPQAYGEFASCLRQICIPATHTHVLHKPGPNEAGAKLWAPCKTWLCIEIISKITII